MKDAVLVIGGGVTGIQAALDLARSGVQVILVEQAPTIGGKMAVLDKNFPTLDCSICIEAPKMSEVGQNKNIELMTLSRVEKLEGAPGRFTATIRRMTRFVSDECTRCADCVTACPVVRGNEMDSSMAWRKAIYTPISQSVPGAYVVDLDSCLNDPPNYLACQRCVEACVPKVINFDQPRETVVTREVSSVVVAAGYDLIGGEVVKEFGYGTHPDILTSMELERLLSSAGPTGGEILKPSDGTHPHRVLLVLCVGSRDARHVRSCSRFCCMYSVKHAFQLADHGVKEVTVLTMDERAYGKGFDEFWQRTEAAGVRFVRGRPAGVAVTAGNTLAVRFENTMNGGGSVREEFDMVVLATAVTPPRGAAALAAALEVPLDADGFFASVEGRGGLMHTARPGVYVAGCASGPKDIPDSVAEGSAAAALALGHARERGWPEPEPAEPIANIAEPRIGVFVCHCGSNIAGVIDVKAVAVFAATLPGVAHAQTQMFSCAGNTQHDIEAVIRDKALSRVVVAACSPKTHEATFKEVCRRAGLNPYLLEMANIRNQGSWVHKQDPEAATAKAMDLIRMSVEKARSLAPLEEIVQPVEQAALVVGGGPAGMAAAAALARQGYPVHLVEREPVLGGLLRKLETLAPAGLSAPDLLRALEKQVVDAGVTVHAGATVETIGGHVGQFHAHLSTGAHLKVGAVIMATGAIPFTPPASPSGWPRTLTNLELEGLMARPADLPNRVTFIGCVGSRQGDAGCSRYCCASMMHQALALRAAGKTVRVLVRDVRTFGRGAEELYEEACRKGVQVFRFPGGKPIEESVTVGPEGLSFDDALLGRRLTLPTDLVVLATALKPADQPLAAQLKLAKSRDGFLLELHPKLGPAETACQGVYLAGSAQAPKDVRESIAQALAAAGKASALLAKGRIEKEPLMARLIAEKCTACFACVKVCPFNAIEAVGKPREGTIRILEAACMGCGTCAAQCNFDAIEMPFFTKPQIQAQIDAALAEKPEEKVLVFACNWCSYAGADQAGVEKIQYPPSSRVIRTMCSARIEQSFVTRAFERGAGAVILTGCRLTEKGSDCHYNWANQNTARRFKMWKAAVERKGIAPARFQLQWISASEGKEFAAKMREMDAIVREYAAGRVAAPAGAA